MAITFAEVSTPTTAGTLVTRDFAWSPSLSLFVSVGDRTAGLNRFMSSPDGTTWTLRNAPEANAYRAVCWSPALSLFVAISSTGTNRVATSPDGINWTARSAASASSWQGVCWSPSLALFVAVGNTNVVMTSPDGTNWTTRSGAAVSKNWVGVAWSPGLGLFAAVATNTGTASIMTSPDGSVWTQRTHASLGSGGFSRGPVCGSSLISWSSTLGLFCANGRTDSPAGGNMQPFTSPDGATWTAQTAPANFSGGGGLVATPSGFVALEEQDSYVSSPDGTTWTRTSITPFRLWDACCYSPDLDVEVASDQSAHDVILRGTGFAVPVQSLSPTSARDLGDVTVTITGNGVNGGFTNQPGANFVVMFYPVAALGASAPDFVTNYFLGGIYAFGKQATNVTWVNANTLTCTPPHGCGEGSQYGLAAGPIAVDVAVFDASKLPVDGANCQFYMAAAFTYVDPVMLSISPITGTVLGGELITITGTNFYPDEGIFALGTNLVRFGQILAFCTYVNPTTLTCVAPLFYGGVGVSPIVDVRFEPSHLSAGTGLNQFAVFAPAATTLLNGYTYTAVWWLFDPTLGFDFEFFDLLWDDFDFGYGIGVLGDDQFEWFYHGLVSPGAGHGWVLYLDGSSPPVTDGWWLSIEGFAGSVMIVVNSRPKNPRSWTKFATFATGTAAMLGGSPGCGCVVGNKLIYAANDYTTFPLIRLFDGTFDREVCTLPPTAAGATPYAIVSMLATNGTIYVSTLDTGTSSADWVGRVFELDIATGTLTPIGAAFTTGHVPYALAWHNGRLYCGTHRQVSTAVGKIYSILPGVDTAWAEDFDLATVSMAGVASMLSFAGTLFVGCTAAAGTFAKVIKRATDGTYSTAETGSGGTAKANNGFLSLAEFNGVIYAGYWNNDTTAITSIRKSADGVTWSVSFTGATTTLRPIIALFVDDGVLYAIGGGMALTAALLKTTDGTTWTNLTANLPDTLETALPVFGVVVF